VFVPEVVVKAKKSKKTKKTKNVKNTEQQENNDINVEVPTIKKESPLKVNSAT
jgi:hypothetical protein